MSEGWVTIREVVHRSREVKQRGVRKREELVLKKGSNRRKQDCFVESN